MRKLYKTTMVIWTTYDPFDADCDIEMSDNGIELLAREAVSGDAYCSHFKSELVENPEQDSTWDGTEFFDEDEEEDPLAGYDAHLEHMQEMGLQCQAEAEDKAYALYAGLRRMGFSQSELRHRLKALGEAGEATADYYEKRYAQGEVL